MYKQGCKAAGEAGLTYLWKLDVVALLDAKDDPVEDALAGLDVDVLDDQSGVATAFLGAPVKLLLPDFAEDHGSIGRELFEERHQGLVFAGACPDGDELLAFIVMVGLQPMFGAKAQWSALRVAQSRRDENR